MNRTTDGYQCRLAACARKGRSGEKLNGRQTACVIVAIALVKCFASVPQAYGDDDGATPRPRVLANQAMSLTSLDLVDDEPSSPDVQTSANTELALVDDLEPLAPGEMGLHSWVNAFFSAELQCELQQLESLLVSAGYDVPGYGMPDFGAPYRGDGGMGLPVGEIGGRSPETLVEGDRNCVDVVEFEQNDSEADCGKAMNVVQADYSGVISDDVVGAAGVEEIVMVEVHDAEPGDGHNEIDIEDGDANVNAAWEPIEEEYVVVADAQDADSGNLAGQNNGEVMSPVVVEAVNAENNVAEDAPHVETDRKGEFDNTMTNIVADIFAALDNAVVDAAEPDNGVVTTNVEDGDNTETGVLVDAHDAESIDEPETDGVSVEIDGDQGDAEDTTMVDAGVVASNVTADPADAVHIAVEDAVDADDSDETVIRDADNDIRADNHTTEIVDKVDDEEQEEEDSQPPQPESSTPMRETSTPAPPPGGSGDIIAGVSILSENAQRITVGRNSSAAIDLKMDCDRAEIADPNIADIMVVSPRRVIVSGKAFGATQMILRVGEQQKVFNVSVEHDMTLLANVIRSFAPTSNVRPQSVNGTIVLTGTVPDAQSGERIAEMASLFQGGQVRNQLTVAGVQQTMLRVVVAEVNKEAVRQLGFNWAIGGADWTRDFFFANNVGGLNPITIGSNGLVDIGASPTPQMTYSIAPVANTAATNMTFGFPRAEFQVFMQALRQNALARVLAEPNLVAISGQTATFLAGGEVPIPVTQGGAVAGAITIEYKEFGIRLAFTPTVFGGQIIRLHVMSEVSDAIPGDSIAGGLPVFSFNTRRVESTVECGNGQTFAMAGLLNETVRAVARKLPGMGDVPVLGALFSSVEYQKNNTELVVLVTPQLVEPLDPQQIPPPPGSLMTAPDDYELFALGQLEGQPNETPSFDRVPREQAPVNTPPRGNANGTPASATAIRGPWGMADLDEN